MRLNTNRTARLIAPLATLALLVAAAGCSHSSPSASTTTGSGATTTSPGTSAPSGTPSHTVWLCRPGTTPDPCAAPLTTTSVAANGTFSAVPTPAPAAGAAGTDCFYVYPTVSSEPGDNADLTIQPAETGVAVAQASRFSLDCQVWAPMYTQQTLVDLAKTGLHGDPTAENKAYDSVLSAWRDYLANDNHGRPFVLIGHSQGAAILIKLIAAQIDGNAAVRSQLVAAIILGGNVQVADGKDVGGSFQHIPACTSVTHDGCVMAYSSFGTQPPADSLFGRAGEGVSLQSNQSISAGQHVLCTDPAALAGGSAMLDSYFPAVNLKIDGQKVTTPWVTYPGRYESNCETADGATWLQVTALGGKSDVRPRVKPSEGPTWGLHGDDANLALGNLVTVVGQLEAAHH